MDCGDVPSTSIGGGSSPLWVSDESGCRSILHSGQVPLTFRSQGSMHAGWNLWSQGRTRRSWPTSKSSVQMLQPGMSSACPATCDVRGDSAAIPDLTDTASASMVLRSGSAVVFVVAPFLASTCSVDASSMSFCTVGSRSPNFTIGNVSNMAWAIPLARLRRGIPRTFRWPYSSGWR